MSNELKQLKIDIDANAMAKAKAEVIKETKTSNYIKAFENHITHKFEKFQQDFLAHHSSSQDLEERLDQKFKKFQSDFLAHHENTKDLEIQLNKTVEDFQDDFLEHHSDIKSLIETKVDEILEHKFKVDKHEDQLTQLDKRIKHLNLAQSLLVKGKVLSFVTIVFTGSR